MFRVFALIVCAALLSLSFTTSAAAQGKPGDVDRSVFIGRWDGVKDFNGAEVTEFDGRAWWDFRADGTFVDGANETGTWVTNGVTLTFQYGAGGMTIFTGNLVGDTVLGTMHNSDSSYTGVFMAQRQQR